VTLIAEGTAAKLRSLDAWDMKEINVAY
jgi:hypothetical protein